MECVSTNPFSSTGGRNKRITASYRKYMKLSLLFFSTPIPLKVKSLRSLLDIVKTLTFSLKGTLSQMPFCLEVV